MSRSEEVWNRQRPLRDLRRNGDILENERKMQFDDLMEETKEDRELCEAAFEYGLIKDRVAFSLIQNEVAEEIRLRASQLGLPCQGLRPDELIEVLKDDAEEKRRYLSLLFGKIQSLKEEIRLTIVEADELKKGLQEYEFKTQKELKRCLERVQICLQSRFDELTESLRKRSQRLTAKFEESGKQLKNCDTEIENLQKTVHIIDKKCDLDFLEAISSEKEDISRKLSQITISAKNEDKRLKEGSSENNWFKFLHHEEKLTQSISSFGSVEDYSQLKLKNARQNVEMEWDAKRSDAEILQFSEDASKVLHNGNTDRRAIAIGSAGLREGVVAARIQLSGLQSNQWAAIGIASAVQSHKGYMIRDSYIVEVSHGTANGKSTVSISFDCEKGRVEYFRDDVKVKECIADGGMTQNQFFMYPYCVLFHVGQAAEFI